MKFEIRQAKSPDDLHSLYEVCLKTGNAGDDATCLYPNIPEALGERWVGGYVALPGCIALALIQKDTGAVVGYTLAALDSTSFYADLRNTWMPNILQKYSKLVKERLTVDEHKLLGELTDPTCNEMEELVKDYPAHLHIDILSVAQGQGQGTRLMNELLTRLKGQSVPGVHLEMHPSNKRALDFYKKLGFKVLCVPQANHDDPLYLGLKL
eukprot:m.46695 g.46695  ORF g.46695 m.46695 type:complete len:210 (+) comp10398_c0_seq1:129-758(+)